jgi:hypothetical protein
MVDVIGFGAAVDEDIIEINHQKFVKEKSKYVIHYSHEGARHI